ncbi:MAG: hypothetical protein AAF225_08375 [Pseudomonadota bacterium]
MQVRSTSTEPSVLSIETALSFLQRNGFLIFKWTVYSLLLVNVVYYAHEDWTVAQHTLTDDASFLKILSAYAASLDVFAWMMLIFIYEVETYWLEDDFDNNIVLGAMTLGKLLFAGLIIQTIYSYSVLVLQIPGTAMIEGARDLCALSGQDLSFVRNLKYTEITAETCGSIAYAGDLYLFSNYPIVTDLAGFRENSFLEIFDLVEAVTWLIILALTELSVRLQSKGHYKGAVVMWDFRLRVIGYLILLLVSIYWGVKGHFVYVWDELLWITSFIALENNLNEWRQELREADETAVAD